MTAIRRRAIEGLQSGDAFLVSRTFTESDVRLFADVSRDYNPIHFDERFTAAKGFRGPICHGLLVGSLLTEVGGQIGWLASGMNFRFRKPVYVGDTVSCEFVLDEVDDRGKARATAVFRNQDGQTVLEAELYGFVPGPEERDVMSAMVREGDTSNGCRRES